jgi:hypothetical protein
MTKLKGPRASENDSVRPERRTWSRPQLVVYGQLAKLTRGGSGKLTETGGLRMCL